MTNTSAPVRNPCGVCGTEVKFTGLPWHVNCKPPCRKCGQPVHNWTVRGVDIHNACDLPSRRII